MYPKPFLHLRAHSDLPPSSGLIRYFLPLNPFDLLSPSRPLPTFFPLRGMFLPDTFVSSRLHFFLPRLSCQFLREAFWRYLRQQLPALFHLFILHGALHPLISNPQIQPRMEISQTQGVSCNKPLSIWDLRSTDFVTTGAPRTNTQHRYWGELCLIYPLSWLSFPHNAVLPIHLLWFVLVLPAACEIVSHSLSCSVSKKGPGTQNVLMNEFLIYNLPFFGLSQLELNFCHQKTKGLTEKHLSVVVTAIT